MIMGPAEHAQTPAEAALMDYGWSDARKAFGLQLNPNRFKWSDLPRLMEKFKAHPELMKDLEKRSRSK